MTMTLEVFTIGGGDLLQEVFNAVATVFNSFSGKSAITSLAITFGGTFALFQFIKSHDVTVLLRWMCMYVVVTSLVLYPTASIVIEDRSGQDIKPRIVDHVPLSLAIFANLTSRLGIGFTETIETFFHMPDDMAYNKTGMLMGSKLVLASRDFQITDSNFSQTLNEFMQQCVFYDLLLQKYTPQDLLQSNDPWGFIKNNTSVARAFSLNGQITPCNEGAQQLDSIWKNIISQAASVYGGQILGGQNAGNLLLSHLSDGYGFLTNVSEEGSSILQTNLLANAISQGISHFSANVNATAAMQAFEETKSELQARETMDITGRQAANWMQQFKNIIEAVLYSAFVLVYFLSYFPFGARIVTNYLCGMFFLQSLAPMYAIINFAATFYAQERSIAFIGSSGNGLSIANIAGITQANADALALAGYLMWPVTIGGALILFRGLPSAIQSMGQYLGGVVQNSTSHVAAEAIGGNLSLGNTNFNNHSQSNTNANHFDTNARFSAGAATYQTATGSSMTLTAGGGEVLDNRGGLSNMAVSVHLAESTRSAASHQAQASISAAYNKNAAAGAQYGEALRSMSDYGQQWGHSENSGESYSDSSTSGQSSSSHQASQFVESWAKEHHVSHERAAQIFGQVYADVKAGGGFIFKGEAGASVNSSVSARSAFGGLYNDAYRYAEDHNFVATVDSARREARESHYRTGDDQGDRFNKSITSSFDRGDSYRAEASSQMSKADSYSTLASSSNENARSIDENASQEFYEWMRGQPAPSAQYGQGTWSKSGIDNASVHEPALLQEYADRFVKEKTSEEMRGFEQSHHLVNGANTILSEQRQNNEAVANAAAHYRHYQGNNEVVSHEWSKSHSGNSSVVNANIESNVKHTMSADAQKLIDGQGYVEQRGEKLEAQSKEKVKGQVLGSLEKSS